MWVNRAKGQVFYLCRRIDGQPRSIHIGTGPLAHKMAAEIEYRKATRQAALEACASRNARVRFVEGPLDDLCLGLDQVVTATLLNLGYHRHDRSKWRKRRGHPEVQTERADGVTDPA